MNLTDFVSAVKTVFISSSSTLCRPCKAWDQLLNENCVGFCCLFNIFDIYIFFNVGGIREQKPDSRYICVLNFLIECLMWVKSLSEPRCTNVTVTRLFSFTRLLLKVLRCNCRCSLAVLSMSSILALPEWQKRKRSKMFFLSQTLTEVEFDKAKYFLNFWCFTWKLEYIVCTF